MHYFQQRYLRENRAFASMAGLEIIDLPNKGLLSGIEIRVTGVNGAYAGSPDCWLHDMMSKIEVIVNGSQVVKSLTGEQLLALMHYQKTLQRGHDAAHLPSGLHEETFYINLGRHYHDPEYMLDLGQVNDPELRIEHNFSLATHHGWTHGCALSTEPSYCIICHILRDPNVVPKGYIKTSEVFRHQSAANRQRNMTVPRGPMYSNLYLQSWYASEGLGINIDHVELNVNSDDIIPIRVQVEELESENVRMYGMAKRQEWVVLTGGQAYPFPIETGHVAGLIGNAEDAMFAFSNIWANLGVPTMMTVSSGAVDTGAHGVHMMIRGAFPFSLAAIPIFDPWDPDTWIKSDELGDLWLRVEETGVAGTNVYLKLLADEVVTRYATPSWP